MLEKTMNFLARTSFVVYGCFLLFMFVHYSLSSLENFLYVILLLFTAVILEKIGEVSLWWFFVLFLIGINIPQVSILFYASLLVFFVEMFKMAYEKQTDIVTNLVLFMLGGAIMMSLSNEFYPGMYYAIITYILLALTIILISFFVEIYKFDSRA